jgi:rhodanese-related sulfurtransferase
MKLLGVFKDLLGKSSSAPSEVSSKSTKLEPQLPGVVEIDVTELMTERQKGNPLLLLDCRETHEWIHMRIPGSLHVPMNTIPNRLAELDKEADIVVVCAHGVRSYDVAGYLTENGFSARSLKGGLAMWHAQGGDVESDYAKAK